MRKLMLLACFAILTLLVSGQDTVLVVEKSIKVAALSPITEYYGFAHGDKVIINVWVEKGKELKDFIISEYPGTVKYAQHTVERVDNKVLDISRNSIYKIEYNNTNIMPRIVNVRIQRVPKDKSTRSFNTGVKWVERTDTSFRSHDTGYDVKSDTTYPEVLNTTIKVNAKSSADNTHRSLVDFTLPANTIRWAYWIGVGEKGNEVWNSDQKKFTDNNINTVSPNPLAAVAMGIAPLTQVKVGENIRYFFISKLEETQKFMTGAGFGQFKQGDMVADFALMNYSNKNSQKYYIGLSNDNPSLPVNVHIRILAVVVVKGYETKGENVPVITTSRVPVHEQ